MTPWSKKSWAESSKQATTGLAWLSKRRSLRKEADLRETFSTDFMTQSLHWRVVPAMRLTRPLAMTTLKCRRDLAFSKDRKDKGEVEASSDIREAKNLDPHIFRERKAIAVRRSFS